MGSTSILIFGQSHAMCLKAAWEKNLYRPLDSEISFQFPTVGTKKFDELVTVESDGTNGIHSALRSELDACNAWNSPSDIWFVSVVRGNTYNVHGLLEPEQPYDFVQPSLAALPIRADVELLPYDAVREVFWRNAYNIRMLYKCLPRQNIKGILHLEAPPPIPSNEQCYVAVERAMLAKSLGRPEDVTVSAREFRLKLWKTQSDVMREVCLENNVIYVTPPNEAIDDEGYLKSEAWDGATHASAWYGALALRKIEKCIAAGGES
jgi:hypothetical protein